MKFAPVLILLTAYYIVVYGICVFVWFFLDIDLGRWSKHSSTFDAAYTLANPFFWTLVLAFCGGAIIFLYISTAHVGYRDSGRAFGDLLAMVRNTTNDLHIQMNRSPDFLKITLPSQEPMEFAKKTMRLLEKLPEDLFHRFSQNEHYDEDEMIDLFFWQYPKEVRRRHPISTFTTEKLLSDYIYESGPMSDLHNNLKQIRDQIGRVDSIRGVPPNDALYRLFIWVGVILGVCVPYLIGSYGWFWGTIANLFFFGTILLIIYTAHVVGPIFDRDAQAYYHFTEAHKNTRDYIRGLETEWESRDLPYKSKKTHEKKDKNDKGKRSTAFRDDYNDGQRVVDEGMV